MSALPLAARLDHMALTSPAPDRLAQFYSRALGLTLRSDGTGGWWGEAVARRLQFVQGPRCGLGYAAFQVPDRGTLESLRSRTRDCDVLAEPSPTPMFDDALCVRDPDGNRLVFGLASGAADGRGEGAAGSFPARLQHVVFASRDAARMVDFYKNALGFVLSDEVVDDLGVTRTSFLRCGPEHHSLAVFQAAADRLDHHCYEAGDWSLIRDWGDHFAAEDIAVQWGPGRHGPGNNLFLFIHDLDGNWLEISAELELVAADRPVRIWPHDQRTLNSWGAAPLRS